MSETLQQQLLEQLAEIEHNQWWGWAEAVKHEVSHGRLKRWKTDSFKPYSELSEDQKKLDRLEAYKVLGVVNDALDAKDAQIAGLDMYHECPGWGVMPYPSLICSFCRGGGEDFTETSKKITKQQERIAELEGELSIIERPAGILEMQEQNDVLTELNERHTGVIIRKRIEINRLKKEIEDERKLCDDIYADRDRLQQQLTEQRHRDRMETECK